jgi:hypothetical protein
MTKDQSHSLYQGKNMFDYPATYRPLLLHCSFYPGGERAPGHPPFGGCPDG